MYVYLHVFRYKAGDECLQSSLGTARPKFGLIGLLSRRKTEQQEFLLHGHWLIMFFFISTRIYDFLALRTTECRYYCRYYLPRFFFCFFFFNDLREAAAVKKIVFLRKYATIFVWGWLLFYFWELRAYKLLHKVFIINFFARFKRLFKWNWIYRKNQLRCL